VSVLPTACKINFLYHPFTPRNVIPASIGVVPLISGFRILALLIKMMHMDFEVWCPIFLYQCCVLYQCCILYQCCVLYQCCFLYQWPFLSSYTPFNHCHLIHQFSGPVGKHAMTVICTIFCSYLFAIFFFSRGPTGKFSWKKLIGVNDTFPEGSTGEFTLKKSKHHCTGKM